MMITTGVWVKRYMIIFGSKMIFQSKSSCIMKVERLELDAQLLSLRKMMRKLLLVCLYLHPKLLVRELLRTFLVCNLI